jgi:hypothetical protein
MRVQPALPYAEYGCSVTLSNLNTSSWLVNNVTQLHAWRLVQWKPSLKIKPQVQRSSTNLYASVVRNVPKLAPLSLRGLVSIVRKTSPSSVTFAMVGQKDQHAFNSVRTCAWN